MKLKVKYLILPILLFSFLVAPTVALLFSEGEWSLSSVNFGVLQPMGEVAFKQHKLFLLCVFLMLLVVVPTIILTIVISFKYHHNNKKSNYQPEWSHDAKLEAIWWGIPLFIVAILAFITWKSSHELDPYKPLVSDEKPIRIQVISLSWKWLFIYPEYDIATVNFIQFPANVPVNFEITADSAMNAFFIPQLGSQIYAMNGMQTKLHLIASYTKDYRGISSNYSGGGFSGMSFVARASTKEEFETWVKDVKNSKNLLTWKVYEDLALPSKNNSVVFYSRVDSGLYMKVIEKYMVHDSGFHKSNTNKHNH